MKNNKSNVITFRLSDEEFKPFAEGIEILKTTRSEFFRSLIVNNFDISKVDKRSEKQGKNLIFYYNKSSNNLNQIAKSINTELLVKGRLDEHLLRRVLIELVKIEESLSFGIKEFENERAKKKN